MKRVVRAWARDVEISPFQAEYDFQLSQEVERINKMKLHSPNGKLRLIAFVEDFEPEVLGVEPTPQQELFDEGISNTIAAFAPRDVSDVIREQEEWAECERRDVETAT